MYHTIRNPQPATGSIGIFGIVFCMQSNIGRRQGWQPRSAGLLGTVCAAACPPDPASPLELYSVYNPGSHPLDQRSRGKLGVEAAIRNTFEHEADEWAEEACVPRNVWQKSSVKFNPAPSAVIYLANSLQIHPAIVAARVRHEVKNCRLLSHFAGNGGVGRYFHDAHDRRSPDKGLRCTSRKPVSICTDSIAARLPHAHCRFSSYRGDAGVAKDATFGHPIGARRPQHNRAGRAFRGGPPSRTPISNAPEPAQFSAGTIAGARTPHFSDPWPPPATTPLRPARSCSAASGPSVFRFVKLRAHGPPCRPPECAAIAWFHKQTGVCLPASTGGRDCQPFSDAALRLHHCSITARRIWRPSPLR